GHVRAQVEAEIDTAVSEQASEQYKPGSQIVRSEQVSQQTNRGNGLDGGVPGALSNEPPPAGVAQPPPAPPAPATSATGATGASTAAAATGATAGAAHKAAAAGAALAATPESTSTQATRNYEIDRTLDYTRQPAGRVKRLTVAVLLDDVQVIGKDGKMTARPLSTQELAHVTQLVKDAVGFDAARGDSVNVLNSQFATNSQPIDTGLEQVPLWQQPLFIGLLKLAAGVVVLLVLALAVLRPLVRSLIGPARAVLTAASLEPPADPALAQPGARSAVQGAAAATAAGPPYEQQVSNARAIVNQDAKRVAQVVRSWVASDE
ncbi:MAG: flagellar M-ring protein FliF C-terminal domain-containing protein, partial [Steroidobacteraceae bacterium]